MQCNAMQLRFCVGVGICRVMATSRLPRGLMLLFLILSCDFICTAAFQCLGRNNPLSSWSLSTSTRTPITAFLYRSSSRNSFSRSFKASVDCENKHKKCGKIHCLYGATGTGDDTVVDCDVIVIGGGLVGTATAVALHSKQQQQQHAKCSSPLSSSFFKAGISVQVYEKASALRPVGAAIGLYPNGLRALQYISSEIHDIVQQTAIPSKIFERRDLQNNVLKITHVNAKNNIKNQLSNDKSTMLDRNRQQNLNTTSNTIIATTAAAAVSPTYYAWYQLQQHFADALPPNTLHLGHCFESFCIDPKTNIIQVTFRVLDNTSTTKITKTCRVLVGADGITSSVRTHLVGGTPRPFQYHGKIMYRAVWNKTTTTNTTRIEHPPLGTQISYQSDKPGKSFSYRETIPGVLTLTAAALASIPSPSSSSLLTVPDLLPSADKNDTIDAAIQRKERLLTLFQEYPVQDIVNQISPHAIHETYIQDIQVEDEWSKGPVVLIGDAAHAMTPHMGQGANQGFEDVCELVHRLLPPLLSLSSSTDSNRNSSNTSENDGGGGDHEHNNHKANTISQACYEYGIVRRQRVLPIHSRSRQNSVQSNTFDKDSAATPFLRRNYTTSFQDWLYDWKPPVTGTTTP